eukprot:646452-Pleurochrysis_carterae.AAC.2
MAVMAILLQVLQQLNASRFTPSPPRRAFQPRASHGLANLTSAYQCELCERQARLAVWES